MKKWLAMIFLIMAGFLVVASPVLAAKKRPPRGSGYPAGSAPAHTYTRGARASVKFRPDRLGLLVSFTSFGNAVSATYTLSYESNGISQGAMGTATPATASETRELLFGTCSHGVCRWHTHITNARLVIDSKLPSGLVVRKPYRIKI